MASRVESIKPGPATSPLPARGRGAPPPAPSKPAAADGNSTPPGDRARAASRIISRAPNSRNPFPERMIEIRTSAPRAVPRNRSASAAAAPRKFLARHRMPAQKRALRKRSRRLLDNRLLGASRIRHQRVRPNQRIQPAKRFENPGNRLREKQQIAGSRGLFERHAAVDGAALAAPARRCCARN